MSMEDMKILHLSANVSFESKTSEALGKNRLCDRQDLEFELLFTPC